MKKIDLTNFDEIIDLLERADESYFNSDKELIADSEYDYIKRLAYNMNKSHPYFVKVGSDVRGGKLKLPYPMYGLNQIYSGEIQKLWVQKYGFEKNKIIITDKLDGVSCMILFADKDGDGDAEFSIAYSRGNTLEGADISRNLKHIHFPKAIKNHSLFVVRGELIVKNETFEKKYKKRYSTARAMVAGCMNRKETDVELLKDIDFVAYSIIISSNSQNINKLNSIRILKDLNFSVPFTQVADAINLNDNLLENIVKSSKESSPYELDGIVLTDDSTLESAKYKIVDIDSIVTPKCKKVHWEISKHGAYKPTVEIEPVKLYGTIVTYATGFNAKFIVDNNIGPGAVLRITKSGSVIPYIMGVEKAAVQPQLPDGGDYEWNESGVELIVKNLDEHPTVCFKQVLDFFESIDVELLKESTMKSLFDALNLHTQKYEEIISLLFDLTEKEWVNIVGVNGAKIYASLHRRLGDMKLETLIGSLKYCGFGFGIRKARQLLAQIDLSAIWSLSVIDVTNLYGFDEKTAPRIVDGLSKIKDFIEENKDYIKFSSVSKTDELKDLNFVFTGFRDNELEEKIEKMGGKVSTGVSKKTSYLISADGDLSSTKCKKAKEHNVSILSLEEFKNKFNL